MKKLGPWLLALGVIGIFVSVNYDATVSGSFGSGDKIYNNGLLNDRTNYVIISCCTAIIGAIWCAMSEISVILEIQNDRSLSIVRMAKKDLIQKGIENDEVDRIINEGNKK